MKMMLWLLISSENLSWESCKTVVYAVIPTFLMRVSMDSLMVSLMFLGTPLICLLLMSKMMLFLDASSSEKCKGMYLLYNFAML